MSAYVEEVDGLYTVREGHGPALLVLHGPIGLDHTHIRKALSPLARHADIICYDSRGNGRSNGSGSRDAITIESLCADAETLRARMDAARVVILGHSGGASIALEYARRHPDRVLGLVLVSGIPKLDYVDSLLAELGRKGTAEQMASLGRLMSGATMEDEEFRDNWLRILPLYHMNYLPQFQAVWDETRFSGAAWVHYRDNIMFALDSVGWLSELKMPSLIITGRHDLITSLEQGALRLQAGLPNSTLEIFERSAHFPFIEEPERFVETVSNWLSRLPTQAG